MRGNGRIKETKEETITVIQAGGEVALMGMVMMEVVRSANILDTF